MKTKISKRFPISEKYSSDSINEVREKKIMSALRDVSVIGDDLQDKHTPLEVCEMMLSRLNLKEAKSILVLYNIELIFALKKYKYLGKITFFTSSLKKVELVQKMNYNVGIEYIQKDENPIYHLEMNFPDKFDIVLSNPPYSGLDIKFMEKSLDLAKDHVVFVHPSTLYINKKDEVIGNASDLIKSKIESKIKYLSLFNGNRVFGIAAKYPISIVHLDMNKTGGDFIFDDKLKKETYSISSLSEISVFGLDKDFNKFRSHISNILESGGNLNSISSLSRGVLREGDFFVETSVMAGHEIRKEDAKCFYKYDFFVLVNSPSMEVKTGFPKKGWIHWRFETNEQAENFLSYISSNFVRACLATVKFNQNLHRGELKSIPLVDFNQKWDDKKIYNHFKISKDMIDAIERNILPYYEN